MMQEFPLPAPGVVKTTCPYCGVGCGVLAIPTDDGEWRVAGDPDHPANFGKLCSKGSALAETLSTEDRLQHPMIANWRVSWDAALDAVASGFDDVIRRHGPDSVAFYLSGQLLTEDYYVANKLMKGFIGSAHVDTNSRLCMASTVAGHKRAFGSDTVPGCYEDLDQTDLIVLVGSNAAWCHPVLYQRMVENRRKRGARIVNIDPRVTATSDQSDMQLSIAPDGDTALFDGLLVYLADTGKLDTGFIDRHTEGFDVALEAARRGAGSFGAIVRRTGLPPEQIEAFYRLFADTERVVTCFSQGVNQSAAGTDKVNAILNCHLATGRIGRPGMGPFSLTGQPNAMGGREVGGLANQLAAHMGFDPASRDTVGRFWNAPNVAAAEGLKAVEMFEAIEKGRIKALWVMATNPVVSLPRADRVRDAMSRLDLLVVSENMAVTDTARLAHIRLPASAWGEKDGTVTNSERRISRQRRFLPPVADARPDWWIISQIGRRMGFEAGFDFQSPADIFREHAALSAFENGGARDFDIGGLARLSNAEYEGLAPVQWPLRGYQGTERLFARGGFFHADGKARFVPAAARTQEGVDARYPLVLNTGRVRDQWHTMTRTGKSARLAPGALEPYLDIHPADMSQHGLTDGGVARVRSPDGGAVLRVRANEGILPGNVFAPIHWTDLNASAGRVGSVVHAVTDRWSGQPASKTTRIRVEPMRTRAEGFLLSRNDLDLAGFAAYWSRFKVDGGWGFLIAHDRPVAWTSWFPSLARQAEGDAIEYTDQAAGIHRGAVVADRLELAAFLTESRHDASWSAIAPLLAAESLSPADRLTLLSGRTAEALPDKGPIVCACMSVGKLQIEAAIRGGCASVEALGGELGAGTNCGSCVPELRAMLKTRTPAPA
ncbi:MAG: molybdopterin-dependent oxidoreductase [Sphingomonadales bacterium]